MNQVYRSALYLLLPMTILVSNSIVEGQKGDQQGIMPKVDSLTNRLDRDGNEVPNDGNFLKIPKLESIVRRKPGGRRPRGMNSETAFAMETETHAVSGKGYMILTDHSNQDFLESVNQLAVYRSAKVINVSDLSKLASDSDLFEYVRSKMIKGLPKYVAVMPKNENFSENTLLACWKLFSGLDSDPELDVLPGFLLASNKASFQKLIQKAITYKSKSKVDLKPFLVSQIPNNRELRSLQKSGLLRQMYGSDTPTVGIYLPAADKAPKLRGDNFWKYQVKGRKKFVKSFSADVRRYFEASNFFVLHGHGIPGMSCGIGNAALESAKNIDIAVCGSCFSAVPIQSDFPAMRQAPGGYKMKKQQSFVMKSVDSGACVAFGHMRLNSGFVHLYPVLESWNKGQSVGESYQQLINGLLKQFRFSADDILFDPAADQGKRRQPKQNCLLYVLIGDPALVPFQQSKR